MSLGVSVVETGFAHELSEDFDSIYGDSYESASLTNFASFSESQWEPRSFIDYKLSEDDLINARLPPVVEYTYSDSSSEAIEESTSVMVIGDDRNAASLIATLEEFNDVTAFDNIEALEKAASIGSSVADVDYYIIAIPATVLADDSMIDTSRLEQVLKSLERHVRVGATVIIESIVPEGTTRRLLEPLIRRKRVKGGISPNVSVYSPISQQHLRNYTYILTARVL